VCRSKHVEPLKNFGIINSITKLHFVGTSIDLIIIVSAVEKYVTVTFILFTLYPKMFGAMKLKCIK